MFDAFSSRSRIVVFVARLVAGERGSTTIDAGDLLVGLIHEDQGAHGSMLSKFSGGEGAVSRFPASTHKNFFDPTIATELLTSIEESLQHQEPIPPWIEIPLSDGLTRVFEAAESYRNQFQQKQVEPLHLLAAILNDQGSVASRELLSAGIIQEEVFESLQGLD